MKLQDIINRAKWDHRFMRLAREVAGWSKDPSSKIGAVIVKDRRVVATGYNGFPAGFADDYRLKSRETKYPRIVHAEMNAILQAGHDAQGAVLYLYSPIGGVPCQNCTKHLITAGIALIVVLPYKSNDRWGADMETAKDMLNEAGVGVREVNRVGE